MATHSPLPGDLPVQSQRAAIRAFCSSTGIRSMRMARQEDGAGVIAHSQVCAPAPHFVRPTQAFPTLLQISDDSSLAGSRGALLEKAGFRVRTTSSAEAEVNRLANDVVVLLLCQTVRPEQAFALLETLRSAPNPPMAVRVTRHAELATTSYDLVLNAPVAPAFLIGELGKLRAKLQGAASRPNATAR